MKRTKFSIIIPSYKRAEKLKNCLACIRKNTYDTSCYEVIVVFSNDIDSTERTITSYIEENNIQNMRLYAYDTRSISTARNVGASLAKYPHVLFIDDDILVQPNTLQKFHDTISQYPQASIIGCKIVLKQHRQIKKYDIFIEGAEYTLTKTLCSEKTPTYISYPRLVFSAIMYINKTHFPSEIFNPRLGTRYGNFFVGGEDVELCMRASLLGKKILYTPDIVASHDYDNARLSVMYFLYRYFLTGVDTRFVDEMLGTQYPEHLRFSLEIDYLLSLPGNILTKHRPKYYTVRAMQYILLLVGYYAYPAFIHRTTFIRKHNPIEISSIKK